MKKILVVGCGGIGSFLIKELHNLFFTGQINHSDYLINIMDFDIVELKNIKYQAFEKQDIGRNKAQVLSEKYHFSFANEKLTDELQLKGYDIIISCVDNSQARKLIYDFCEKNNIYYIDGRSEGRAIACFTYKPNNLKKMLATLNLESTGNTSCQNPFELNKGIIQQGNKIVAVILSQLLLNKIREVENNEEYIFYF